jgi:hypothetical protein
LSFIRGLLLGVGLLAVVVGLIWVGQGTGTLNWPEKSYMIGDQKWAVNGGIAVVLGLVGIFFGRPR